MTGTNHALTGAVIALTIKRPELAVPLALVSHFLLDALPHYNPPGVNRDTVKSASRAYPMKLAHHAFRYIFAVDMALLVALLVMLPIASPSGVSPWTTFGAMLAAISPDFVNGRYLIYHWLGIKVKRKPFDLFTRFHLWWQWCERPWGIWVEITYGIAAAWLAYILIK